MKKIAILLTVFNRIDKTLNLFSSLDKTFVDRDLDYHIYLTDDGSSDNTVLIIKEKFDNRKITFLQGNGSLYWNGGMINSWKAALEHTDYDGYLWLNNDVVLNTNLWEELIETDTYSINHYKKSNEMGPTGIEPATTRLRAKCSSRLSYGPH